MSITCHSVFKMEKLKNQIRLLGGARGLSNAVRWTHVLESMEALQFLQGNELTFLTGVHFGSRADQLVAVVEKLSEKHVAGLVINTGKFILSVSQEVIDKADELDLPLFEIPWEVRLVDVTKMIGAEILKNDMESESVSQLLKQILFSEQKSYADYLRTAEFYGYPLAGPLRIAILEIINLSGYAEQHARQQEDGTDVIRCRLQFKTLIERVLESYSKKCISMWKENRLILAVPVTPALEAGQVENVNGRIQNEIAGHMDGLVVHIGLGGYYDGIERLKKSYSEARLALKLTESTPGFASMLYKNAGIYKFLNKIDDKKVIVEFFKETLEPLLEYDGKNGTQFTETLRVYLEEGENTLKTVQRLYIHRNTLQYRLGRIEDILQQSLKNTEEKINLCIAFKIEKFLNLKGMPV